MSRAAKVEAPQFTLDTEFTPPRSDLRLVSITRTPEIERVSAEAAWEIFRAGTVFGRTMTNPPEVLFEIYVGRKRGE